MSAASERARTRRRRLLGDRLRVARERAELDQRDVAALLSVHPNDVRRFEAGTDAPSALQLAALAEAFAVSSDYLLGLNDHARAGDVPAGLVPTALLHDAVRLTHPDLHTPGRADLATRVTQHLNALIDGDHPG